MIDNLVCVRYLLPLLLQYDSTAEESYNSETHGVGASVQIAKNIHAMRACQALSRLGGVSTDEDVTPHNKVAFDALIALLTPKLASMLKDQSPRDLLAKLNSTLETPEVNDGGCFFQYIRLFCMSNIGFSSEYLMEQWRLPLCYKFQFRMVTVRLKSSVILSCGVLFICVFIVRILRYFLEKDWKMLFDESAKIFMPFGPCAIITVAFIAVFPLFTSFSPATSPITVLNYFVLILLPITLTIMMSFLCTQIISYAGNRCLFEIL